MRVFHTGKSLVVHHQCSQWVFYKEHVNNCIVFEIGALFELRKNIPPPYFFFTAGKIVAAYNLLTHPDLKNSICLRAFITLDMVCHS